MRRLVSRALLARGSQSLWLVVLVAVSVSGLTAAPLYHVAALNATTAVAVESAPLEQRILVIARRSDFAQEPVSPDEGFGEVSDVLLGFGIPTDHTVAGQQALAILVAGGATVDRVVAYRDGACDHMIVEGTCPAAADEMLLGASTAARFGVGRGDTVTVQPVGVVGPVTFRVVGTYEATDLGGLYWISTGLLSTPASRPSDQTTKPTEDAAFTTAAGVLRAANRNVDTSYQVELPVAAFADSSGGGLDGRLRSARNSLIQRGYAMTSGANTLAQAVARDRRAVSTGVGMVAAQILLLCWLSVFLATRHTAEDRRPDLALLKLRGLGPRDLWAFSGRLLAVPLMVAAALGSVAGYAAGPLLALAWTGSAVPSIDAALPSVGLIAAAVALGAVVVAMAAESRSLRASVVGLLRRVPGRGSRWGADIVDLAVVLLALGAMYQSLAEGSRQDRTILVLLAPGLLALALGLIASRAVGPISTRVGVILLRAGRIGAALATLNLARRPAANRVVAVMALAVALLGSTLVGAFTSAQVSRDRAWHELGAARVLTVDAPSPQRLLAAVRGADPNGQDAMAVVEAGITRAGPVLAVDAPRLASVVPWDDTYGIGAAEVVRALRPPAPAPIELTDGPLTLWARVPAGDPATEVTALLARLDGTPIEVTFVPVDAGDHPVTATLSGCPSAALCRLVGFRSPAPTVTLHRLDGAGDTVIAATVFGDAARWRPAAGVDGIGSTIAARDDGLLLTRSTNPLPADRTIVPDGTVYVVDVPLPLPVVSAGNRTVALPLGDDRMAPTGSTELPYRVAATAPALPRVGTDGALVDLESAIRASPVTGLGRTFEVWLTADASPSIVDSMVAGGIAVVRDDTIATATTRYTRQGPAAVVGYGLSGALVSLLVAAGLLLVVGIAQRRPRATELAALRTQGMTRPVLRRAAHAPPLLLVSVAVPVGLFSSAIAGFMVPLAPVGTEVGSVPGSHLVPMAVAVAVAVIAFAGAGAISIRPLVRATTNGPGTRSR